MTGFVVVVHDNRFQVVGLPAVLATVSVGLLILVAAVAWGFENVRPPCNWLEKTCLGDLRPPTVNRKGTLMCVVLVSAGLWPSRTYAGPNS